MQKKIKHCLSNSNCRAVSTKNCKIHAKILLSINVSALTEYDFLRLLVFYAHVILAKIFMYIICVYKDKVVFFMYVIANRINILEKPACDTWQHRRKETYVYRYTYMYKYMMKFFLYLFAMVLHVMMDVIKNRNFCSSRLLIIYIMCVLLLYMLHYKIVIFTSSLFSSRKRCLIASLIIIPVAFLLLK